MSEGSTKGMEALLLTQREIVAPKIDSETSEARRDVPGWFWEILGQKGGAKSLPLARRCCWRDLLYPAFFNR